MKLNLTLCAAFLTASLASAQGGDDCTNATPISGFGTFAFDNTNASGSGLSDCNGLGVRKDVWFDWTSPTTGLARFETCGTITSFDTRIAAYDGTCTSLGFLGCATDSCMGQSRMSFDAVAGQRYLLRVGSRVIGTGGPGEIRMSQDPCPTTLDDNLENNDVCDDATPVTDGTIMGLWCSKADPDWYSTCVPAGGILTIDLTFTDAAGDIDMFCFGDCTFSPGLGIGGSGTDDEQVIIDNSANTSAQSVVFRVELWADDPTQDCNNYSMTITGSGAGCGDQPLGMNYCNANPNSTGSIAVMGATGSDVVADNDVTLNASNLPPFSFSFFLTSLTQGFVANPAGSQGNLCVVGQIGRYVGPGQIQQADTSGEIALGIDLTQIPQPATGFQAVVAGETWYYQAWYRDQVGGSSTSNFTDGLSIMYL